MDNLECEICCYRFDLTNRRPKNLQCGHIFCMECMGKEIRNGKTTCPTCRHPHNARSIDDLPICILVERLIRDMPQTSSEGAKSHNSDDDDDDDDYSGGPCTTHKKKEVYFFCKNHSIKVCEVCLVMDHPATKCNITSYKEEIESGKAKAISQASSSVKEIDDTLSELNDMVKVKNDNIKRLKEEIDKVTKKMAEEQKDCANTYKAILNGKAKRKSIEEAGQNLQNAEKKKKITQLRTNIQATATDIMKWRQDVQTQFDISQVTSPELQAAPANILMALNRNKSIYAETIIEGTKKKIAIFTSTSGKLHMHPFNNQILQTGAIAVQYDVVLRHLSSQPPTLMFLNLVHSKTGFQGRVYIKLQPELDIFIKHIPDLFHGKVKDTVMGNKCKPSNPNYFEIGINRSVNDISSRKKENVVSKSGDVVSYIGNNSINDINITIANNHTYSSMFSKIGHVEGGLDVLKACKGLGRSEQNNITISDCGLVLEI